MRITVFMMLWAGVISSAAAEWVEVDRKDTTTVYADPATIHMGGNLVKMWSLYDFKTIQAIDGLTPYMSSRQQYEFDCKEKRLRTFSFSFHSANMAQGEVTVSATRTGNWEPIASGSTDEGLWRAACKKR